jgi:hypothetical protein
MKYLTNGGTYLCSVSTVPAKSKTTFLENGSYMNESFLLTFDHTVAPWHGPITLHFPDSSKAM